MPHLVILYTRNLDAPEPQGGSDMTRLCRRLADTMIAARDEADKPVFPVGGVRVLAYPVHTTRWLTTVLPAVPPAAMATMRSST